MYAVERVGWKQMNVNLDETIEAVASVVTLAIAEGG
jgi:hypothetical protein